VVSLEILPVNDPPSVPIIVEESLDEDSSLSSRVRGQDIDNDPLSYEWKLDGETISEEKSYAYKVGYDAAGSHTIKVSISDGITETTNIWSGS